MQFAHETERRLIQKIYGRIAPTVMVTMTIHSLSLQQETHKAAHRQTCSIRSSRMTSKPSVTCLGKTSALVKPLRKLPSIRPLTFNLSLGGIWRIEHPKSCTDGKGARIETH
jgi:hypothetical protein